MPLHYCTFLTIRDAASEQTLVINTTPLPPTQWVMVLWSSSDVRVTHCSDVRVTAGLLSSHTWWAPHNVTHNVTHCPVLGVTLCHTLMTLKSNPQLNSHVHESFHTSTWVKFLHKCYLAFMWRVLIISLICACCKQCCLAVLREVFSQYESNCLHSTLPATLASSSHSIPRYPDLTCFSAYTEPALCPGAEPGPEPGPVHYRTFSSCS